MSKKVEIVAPGTFIDEVARKMQHSDCGSVLVAANDRLIGVITDRDLALRCVALSHDPTSTKAEEVMTKQILYCLDTDNLEDVAENMTRNRVRRMPVLDKDKRLVGIVSLGDIASNSTDEHYLICGKALGHICAVPSETMGPRHA